jgi:hypothetical protein
VSEQNNAAAERSAHVTRGSATTIKETFLVEVSKGVFQLKAVAEVQQEAARLRAALEKIAHSADYDTIVSPDGDRHQQAIDIALEALEGGNV